MKWCCEGLKQAFEDRHNRGIYIYCEPDHSLLKCGPTFWMGMRSVNTEDSGRFSELMKTVAQDNTDSLPITIGTWRRVKFCPWCGKNLERYYKKNFDMLIDETISKEHGWKAD